MSDIMFCILSSLCFLRSFNFFLDSDMWAFYYTVCIIGWMCISMITLLREIYKLLQRHFKLKEKFLQILQVRTYLKCQSTEIYCTLQVYIQIDFFFDFTFISAIDAPGGFLFEWWSVFWDIFIARTNEKHSEAAASYIEVCIMVFNSSYLLFNFVCGFIFYFCFWGLEVKTVASLIPCNLNLALFWENFLEGL